MKLLQHVQGMKILIKNLAILYFELFLKKSIHQYFRLILFLLRDINKIIKLRLRSDI